MRQVRHLTKQKGIPFEFTGKIKNIPKKHIEVNATGAIISERILTKEEIDKKATPIVQTIESGPYKNHKRGESIGNSHMHSIDETQPSKRVDQSNLNSSKMQSMAEI